MKNAKNEAEKWPAERWEKNVATIDGTQFVDIEAEASTNSTFNVRQCKQMNKNSKSIRCAMIYRHSTFSLCVFLFHTIASKNGDDKKTEVIFGRAEFNFTIVNAKSNCIGTLTICVKGSNWMTLFSGPFCCLAAFWVMSEAMIQLRDPSQQRIPLNLWCVWFSINIPFFGRTSKIYSLSN